MEGEGEKAFFSLSFSGTDQTAVSDYYSFTFFSSFFFFTFILWGEWGWVNVGVYVSGWMMTDRGF